MLKWKLLYINQNPVCLAEWIYFIIIISVYFLELLQEFILMYINLQRKFIDIT